MSENIANCPNCNRNRYKGYQEGHAALLKHVEKSLMDAHQARPIVIKVDATPEMLKDLQNNTQQLKDSIADLKRIVRDVNDVQVYKGSHLLKVDLNAVVAQLESI